MPLYKTEYVLNLRTGEPITLEVPVKYLGRFERQKKLVEAGQVPGSGNIKDFTENREFCFFPAYQEILKIWLDNKFTTELITQILSDFGIDEAFIQKLLEDECYISEVKPCFEGITCDGERAIRTLKTVYRQTKSYYSLRPLPTTSFPL